jgi:hypothetical protein
MKNIPVIPMMTVKSKTQKIIQMMTPSRNKKEKNMVLIMNRLKLSEKTWIN